MPPHGYRASVYASGLRHPTALAFGPGGRLYVSEDVGAVVSVTRGTSHPRPFLRRLLVPLGVLWRGRTLYVSESGRVEAPYVARQGTALGRAGRVHVDRAADGTIWVGGGTVTCVTGSVRL